MRSTKRPRSEMEQTSIVPLSNRFEPPSKNPMDDDGNIDDCREVDTEKNTKSLNKNEIPPIVITQEMEDYSKFIK